MQCSIVVKYMNKLGIVHLDIESEYILHFSTGHALIIS